MTLREQWRADGKLYQGQIVEVTSGAFQGCKLAIYKLNPDGLYKLQLPANGFVNLPRTSFKTQGMILKSFPSDD